jgi:predicted helicase
VNSKELFRDIQNWEGFVSMLENLNKKEKGDAFELLAKLYFKLSPKYNFYDEVWMLSEVPVNVIEELGIPSHDLGIDLIAKSGKEYHAIQCKYHSDKNQSVTFKEVSTFISLLESNSKFTQGYICSSADITSRNYNKLNTKPINLILSDSWQELPREFFENARHFLSRKKVSLVPFKPKEHQTKALADASKYFSQKENTRGKLIFPCGAGKSLTGFWLIEELKSKSTLIAVPSLSLVKQTLDVYLREIVAHKRKIKWLCICSDEGIGQDDDVVFYTENLGVPCQTDPVYIEQWLKENKKEEIVVFTTYQSGRLIAEISKKLKYSFDLGIFDEAHKTVGSDIKLFSHLLFEENISIKKRIFMTATERFYRGSKDDIISMDNYDIYGETFTQMSFKEAIELGLLTDYKVITIDVKKSEIAEFIRQNNLVQLNNKWGKETEARSLASMLALRKAMKRFPIKNAVSFHSSIDKAIRNKELQNYITDTYNYEPIESYTVSGKIPTSKRNVIVQEFARSPKSLITNARCLTEGVDVPNIDCIVFSDPRKSKVDIVQALGRALRKKEGKEWGYVVLPIIYDEETQDIDNENFQEILSVVRGLASNDERIVEYFKEKNDPKSSRKKTKDQFQLEVFSEYLDEAELSNQLEIRLWEKLSSFSWLPFEEAREYVQNLQLRNVREWESYKQKLPFDIPKAPQIMYQNSGWISWGNWLGTNNVSDWKKEWLSYNEAQLFVQNLNLKSGKEWIAYCKSGLKPDNIPSSPSNVYKSAGWESMGEWLGHNYVSGKKRKYLSFEEAKKIVITLNLKSETEWRIFIKSGEKPTNIPSKPDRAFKDEWHSWGDWLGTKSVATYKVQFISFHEAKELIHQYNISSFQQWKDLIKSQDFNKLNIPKNPPRTYLNEWEGWEDFFGHSYSSKQNNWPSLNDAKILVKSLNIKSQSEYRKTKKNNLPSHPDRVYKSEWKGWADFLGKKE